MPGNHNDIEKPLWGAANELRPNSKLKAFEYSRPVLGLIFLKYADLKFRQAEEEFKGKGSDRRPIGKLHYQAQDVLYLPESARFSKLIKLHEGTDIGNAINEPMKSIEPENEVLKSVLPMGAFTKLERSFLLTLLKTWHLRLLREQKFQEPKGLFLANYRIAFLPKLPIISNEFIRDIVLQIISIIFQIRNLRTTRELLLSRLFSEYNELEINLKGVCSYE